jgi:DNA-binding YbaB/EbfC family protein
MLKQAQQMQEGLQSAQEELAKKTVEATVAGGKVCVTATGAGEVTRITIDPSVVDPADVEFLQELVLKAVQDAIQAGKEMAAAEMKKLTGGLGLPGMPGFDKNQPQENHHEQGPTKQQGTPKTLDDDPQGKEGSKNGQKARAGCRATDPAALNRLFAGLSPCARHATNMIRSAR